MLLKQKLSGLVISVYLLQPTIVLAGAVDIPVAAREAAEDAVFAVKSQLYAEESTKFRREANDYMKKAATISSDADQQVLLLEKDLAKKKLLAEKSQRVATDASVSLKCANANAEALMAQADAAWQRATEATLSAETQEARLEQQISAAESTIANSIDNQAAIYQRNLLKKIATAKDVIYIDPTETDELLLLENEIRQQETAMLASQTALPEKVQIEVEAQDNFIYPGFAIEQASVDSAYARANDLQNIAEDIQAAADAAYAEADDRQRSFDVAIVALDEAKQAVSDNEYVLSDAKMTAADARKESTGAKTYYEQLVFEQNNPPAYSYIETDFDYYRWKSGNKQGYQLVQPVRVGYSHKNSYYGLTVNHIMSNNISTENSGKVNTFSDTIAYISRKQEKKDYIFDYNLSVNIPTGKATLSSSERNARMNDDLVAYSQFGEGWNISPAIAITRKIGKEDSWTFSTGYNWRGSYDPTNDIENDDLNPGDEWHSSLRWQHAGEKWQIVSEVLYTTTGNSTVANGESYNTGDTWEGRLTYNFALPRQQNVMLYYWYDHEDSILDLSKAVKVSPIHYFGTEWSKKLLPDRTLRVAFDGMAAPGKLYDSLNNDYVNDRHKYTFGVGYDIELKREQKLSFDIQKFILKDGARENGEAEKYHGINFFVKYGGNF